MRAISGKSVVNDKAVALWILTSGATKIQEYYIVREFESHEKMKLFYDSVEISKNRFTINRMKVAFCKHKKTKSIISSNEKYKYEVCVKCGYGVHESLLSEEEKRINSLETNIKFSKFDVHKLKNKINSLERKVKFMKVELAEEIRELEKLEKLYEKMKNDIKSREISK